MDNLFGSQIKKLSKNAKLILDGDFFRKNIEWRLISKTHNFFNRFCAGL